MLVLARRVDESIMIGDDIEVKVVSVDKGIVTLGINAPSHVAILRNELVEDVKKANLEAQSNKASNEDIQSLKELLKK